MSDSPEHGIGDTLESFGLEIEVDVKMDTHIGTDGLAELP
jgi:hypothetical protein